MLPVQLFYTKRIETEYHNTAIQVECKYWTVDLSLDMMRLLGQLWPAQACTLKKWCVKVGIFFSPQTQAYYCLKEGTTWSSLFQLEGTVTQRFMLTTLSQDLYAEAWSVSQAEQHVCNVASCAPGPLRNPALCRLLQKWVSKNSLYCSLSIPRYLAPSLSCSLWGHVLGTRIACDSTWALFTFRAHTHTHTHTHTHNAAYPCADLDFHAKTNLRWDLVVPLGGALEAQGVEPCANKQKGTWHLVSYQPGDMINRVVKSCGIHLQRTCFRFTQLIPD